MMQFPVFIEYCFSQLATVVCLILYIHIYIIFYKCVMWYDMRSEQVRVITVSAMVIVYMFWINHVSHVVRAYQQLYLLSDTYVPPYKTQIHVLPYRAQVHVSSVFNTVTVVSIMDLTQEVHVFASISLGFMHTPESSSIHLSFVQKILRRHMSYSCVLCCWVIWS